MKTKKESKIVLAAKKAKKLGYKYICSQAYNKKTNRKYWHIVDINDVINAGIWLPPSKYYKNIKLTKDDLFKTIFKKSLYKL